ncbi:MAG: hypothetical protein GC190_06670 [Alphaproteobacteria bacterium]|nr:hypothetical protein [Alphaproteobacteria bacterium]
MKLLASLALGTATFVAAMFGLTAPAAADDDVTVGVRLGPLCVGLCIGGSDHRSGRHHDEYGEDYYNDGFYAHRENYYHQTYDRRNGYDYGAARNDGYAGYRRHAAAYGSSAPQDDEDDDSYDDDDE